MKPLPLYTGKMLRLTPLNIEKDAPIVAQWTYHPDVAERFRDGPANPMTVFEVKKIFEKWVKDAEDSGRDFVFAFRPHLDEDMIGFLRIAHVQWVHGAGLINLVIGESQAWETHAQEALEMTLNYAFDELNLFRVTMRVNEDDLAARALLLEASFTLEVRQRQAVYRGGQYLDRLSFGMLRPEWQVFHSTEVA
jgi:RimJ/RimL family protein N-acetyltransferase